MSYAYTIYFTPPMTTPVFYDSIIIYDEKKLQTNSLLLSLASDNFFSLIKDRDKHKFTENSTYNIDIASIMPNYKKFEQKIFENLLKLLEGQKIDAGNKDVDEIKQICKEIKAEKLLYFIDRSVEQSKKHKTSTSRSVSFVELLNQKCTDFLKRSKILQNKKEDLLKEEDIRYFTIEDNIRPGEIYFQIIDESLDLIDFDSEEKLSNLHPICFAASINRETITEKFTETSKSLDHNTLIDALCCAAIYGCFDTFKVLFYALKDRENNSDFDDEEDFSIEDIFADKNIFLCAVIGASTEIVDFINQEVDTKDIIHENNRRSLHYTAMFIFQNEKDKENYLKIMTEKLIEVTNDIIVFDDNNKSVMQYIVENYDEILGDKIIKSFSSKNNQNDQNSRRRRQNNYKKNQSITKEVTNDLIKYVKINDYVKFKNLLNLSSVSGIIIEKFEEKPFLNIICEIPERTIFIKEFLLYNQNRVIGLDPTNGFNSLFASVSVDYNEQNIIAILESGIDLFSRLKVKLSNGSFQENTIFSFLSQKKNYPYLNLILKYMKDTNYNTNNARNHQIVADTEELYKIFGLDYSMFKFHVIDKRLKPDLKSAESKVSSTASTIVSDNIPVKQNVSRSEIPQKISKIQQIPQISTKFPTPLSNFSKKMQNEAIKDVLDPEYPINFQDRDGFTPLILAAKNNLVSVLEKLITIDGIDMNLKEKHGHTAASIAANAGQATTLSIVLDHWRNPDLSDVMKLLYECVIKSDTKFIQLFFKRFEDTAVYKEMRMKDFVVTNDGQKALQLAAQKGHTEVVKFILQKMKVSIDSVGKGDTTALMAAISSHKEKTVKELLDIGASIDLKDDLGKTALVRAVESKEIEIIRMLLKKGADPNDGIVQRNEGIRSAFLVALLNKEPDIVSLLLSESKYHPVDLHTIYNGMYPLDHAKTLAKQFESNPEKYHLMTKIINIISAYL
ncbi:hypothetical protein TVAG_402320 [Trichomonas vaginalis G3]|uniref:Uncharacterized protein n=1 Tax=Trichomonas vaginalis (strain ATCC PRA-98 / G3) TaxID=412133 RepID=A2DHY8_TRIV3|nr:spectrin binding [Trichomonas vaginalis G3]EAY19977.1 hypothetical protein TVAG_402320 [Trichomonas vaginalis G3]KAI5525927.1 spectrin binding [Trichomonas vaginalis G3]|eukprot:XP_001580963.1 hypothetical protein [Trichomonas vaginalis G3]